MVLPTGFLQPDARLIMWRAETLFIDGEHYSKLGALRYCNNLGICYARLLMNSNQFTRIAVLTPWRCCPPAGRRRLESCSRGDLAGGSARIERTALNPPTALVTFDPGAPAPASAPEPLPWNDPVAGGNPVSPAAAPADSGGEPPYPDLRMLPTQPTAFEPVVFGDVACVGVTPAL